MNPTRRVRAALHEAIAPVGALAEDGSVVLPMLPETDGVVPLVTLAAVQPPLGGGLAFLGSATEWLNSPPLTAAELRGKVVLVQFWTYSCINWLRTLPYVRAWAERYRDHGLVVIGIHTPEFDFEHDLDIVRRAAMDLRVDYPVVVDNDYAIWSAFNNHYWPALYLVDRHENVRHHRLGEDDYEAPTAPGGPIRFRVRLDGQPPAAAYGTDVDDQGAGAVTEPRLYQLIRQPGPVIEHTFEITFLDPGVAAYAFTFG
jgi:thiol-disulfide isomerase/thioredoxin